MIKTSSVLERMQFKVALALLTFQKHPSHLEKNPNIYEHIHTYTVSIQTPLLFYLWREGKASSKASFANTCKNTRVPRWQLGIIATPGRFPLQTLASVDDNDVFIFPLLSLQIIIIIIKHQSTKNSAKRHRHHYISIFLHFQWELIVPTESSSPTMTATSLPVAFLANAGNHTKVPKADANYLQHMQKYQDA